MKYNEHHLAELAATIASGLAARCESLQMCPDREAARHAARDLARMSLLLARHIIAGAHVAAMKDDELELLYDDADFL